MQFSIQLIALVASLIYGSAALPAPAADAVAQTTPAEAAPRTLSADDTPIAYAKDGVIYVPRYGKKDGETKASVTKRSAEANPGWTLPVGSDWLALVGEPISKRSAEANPGWRLPEGSDWLALVGEPISKRSAEADPRWTLPEGSDWLALVGEPIS